MAVRPFIPQEDPRLRQVAKPVGKVDKACKALAQDLIDTMIAHQLVGIASPQLGVLKRVIALNGLILEPQEPPIVMINPRLLDSSGMCESEEASPTFPGIEKTLRRASYVKVLYTDLQGKRQIFELGEGHVLTCAVQHELDHLEGILFTEKALN